MIKELIYEYWNTPLPALKKREINLDAVSLDLMNDIVGIRRAGKTYLMFYLINDLIQTKKVDKKATIYINFENRRLYPLKKEYLNQIIEFIYAEELLGKYGKVYLFLDEIQNIEEWQRWIRGVYDEFKGKIKIFISGSNEKLLRREYSQLLTGRHLTINVFPLSFREFLEFNNVFLDTKKVLLEKKRSIIKKRLNDFVKFGGFPEVALSPHKEKVLQQYFSDIISRDVVFKEKIRKDISVIEELGAYFINNIATLASFRRLNNYFNSKGTKISLPTLQHYYHLFENAFLFFSTKIFSYKIKDQLQYPMKIYCIDTGLINVSSFKFSRNLGKLYENIVAVELKRRNKDIYYWKDYQHREVDFVIKEGLKVIQLVQVCFDIEDIQTQKREIGALLKASKELSCGDLFIITEEVEKQKNYQGVKINYIPLWKWLLYD